MCSIFSCVVGRGCLLWPVHSLGKILLAFALLNFVLQGQICLLLQVSLDFLLLHFIPLIKKTSLGSVSSRRSFRSSFRFFQHYWLRHRLGLLWYWMVCLGNKQRSFCHCWDCTKILHFRFCCWLWGLLHFFLEILSHSSRYNVHLNEICPLQSILVHWFLNCWCSFLPSFVTRNATGIWWSRRMCTHLLKQELQNCNSLLNNHQQENVGSHQKRYPKFKDKEEAPTRW